MTRKEKNKEIQDEVIKEENEKKIKQIIKTTCKIIFILLMTGLIFFTYTTYISTKKITIREYRIINQKIPNSFNGTKIIHFTDLHYGSTMDINDLKKITKLINERNPDLVLFTGDLIYQKYELKNDEKQKIIDELSKIDSSLGKYAILGNEDNEIIGNILTQCNFKILRNEYELIYNNDNNPIQLIGLSSSLKNEIDLEKSYSYFNEPTHNSNIYTITILHEPDTVDKIINNYQTDLFLAGHSHNGTITIPYFNYPIIKEKEAIKYSQEYYKLNNGELYISGGLGTQTGIRLFQRPSINFYRISNK